MSNQWFRMYAEVLNDPKVQTLPAELFKVWVNTLCIACNNNGTLPKLEDVSFALRLPFHETKIAFQELEKFDLIVTDGETFQFKNWKKRQYKSDVSTERVKRYRKQKRNVSETPPDTDTEQNRIIRKNTKKKTSKIPLAEWEISHGELSPAHLREYQEKHKLSFERICEMILQFRLKCEAQDYRYADFSKAFQSWRWDDPQQKVATFQKKPPVTLSNMVIV